MQAPAEYLITQNTFSVLLQAMSHPGRIYSNSPLLYVLRTLLDQEVGFCAIGTEKEYLETNVAELTGCPITEVSKADFIIVPGWESKGEILKAKRGTLEYPDTGATVIYAVESLRDRDNGKTIALLTGPGIRNEVALSGLGRGELSHIREINSEFPLGIDCIFADSENRIMCIPRSTKLEVR